MLIGYASEKLRKICEETRAARKHLPQRPAALLPQRLSDLAAFSSLAAIPPGAPLHFHPLRGDLTGQFAVSIDAKHRIVFRPAGRFESQEDGMPVLSSVNEIEITYVGDYHDD